MKLNAQGIYCLPEYDVAHHKGTARKMLRRGYNAYGYGGFFCFNCKTPSPMRHKTGCAHFDKRNRIV